MTNLEWLEKVKKADGDVDEPLKKAIDEGSIEGNVLANIIMEYRKIKALEIIAEELIKHNENSGCIVTALENIDTTLNRR